MGARRVFGDVGDLDIFFHGEVDRFGAALDQKIEVPVFGELSDFARSDERVRDDGHARLLHEIRDGPDVVGHGARGGDRTNLQFGARDFLAGVRRHLNVDATADK